MASTASFQDIQVRFGSSTPRRQFLFEQLQTVVHRLRGTGQIKNIYLFGSFVTGKDSPNDIDLFVIMSSTFSTVGRSEKDMEVFQHDVCRILFHADVFWVTEAVGADRIEDMLEVFSRDRDGRAQPVIEVKL